MGSWALSTFQAAVGYLRTDPLALRYGLPSPTNISRPPSPVRSLSDFPLGRPRSESASIRSMSTSPTLERGRYHTLLGGSGVSLRAVPSASPPPAVAFAPELATGNMSVASAEAFENESSMEGSSLGALEMPSSPGSALSARRSLRLQLESSLGEEGSSPPNSRMSVSRSPDLWIRPRIVLRPPSNHPSGHTDRPMDVPMSASVSLERSLSTMSTQSRPPLSGTRHGHAGREGLNKRHSLDWSSLFGPRTSTMSDASSQRSSSPSFAPSSSAAAEEPSRPPSSVDQDPVPSDETWWNWGRRR
jgi:hypothetical protein